MASQSFGTDHFIIDGNKTHVVAAHFNRIKKLFNVQINFDVTFESDDKQWILISGSSASRHYAKVGIIFFVHS